ncbi:MFS transporter [Yimella sp. cx-573]|nr:MFS transporter [Yimella sp. cx-573]
MKRVATPGLLVALLLATLVIRAPLTSVPPALPLIRDDLGLGAVAAGMVTTLPLICFGVFAFLTPLLAARVGVERTLGLALAAIASGIAVRLVVDVSTFFLGTLLIGLGIAVANVVIPAIARLHFASDLARVMGLYTVVIQVSGASGGFLTRPLIDGVQWKWPLALGVWLGPAFAVLAVWTSVSRGHRGSAAAAPAVTRIRGVAQRRVTWVIVAVMGLQSLVFFTVVNWLPTLLADQGWSSSAAGIALGAFSILGFPGSMLGARVLQSSRRTTWIAAVASIYVFGLALLVMGTVPAAFGVLLCGLCQGLPLAIALSAIAHQQDPADVPAVSAVAQGAGYLLASLGPLVAGALYAAAGDFMTSMIFLALSMFAWASATVAVGRAQDGAVPAPR